MNTVLVELEVSGAIAVLPGRLKISSMTAGCLGQKVR
jgi:hypothetical protein